MTLVGLYVLNEVQTVFYKKLYNMIGELEYEHICIVGDFNAIVDRELDHKSDKRRKTIRRILPNTLFKMVEELCIKDSWRERNGKEKQYTYYSGRHNT